jgi:hypothetical protein
MNSFKKDDIVKYIWPRPNTLPNLGKILLDNNSVETKMYYVEFQEENKINYEWKNEWWSENAIILVNDNTTNTTNTDTTNTDTTNTDNTNTDNTTNTTNTDNKGQKKYKDTKNLIEYYDTINNTASN